MNDQKWFTFYAVDYDVDDLCPCQKFGKSWIDPEKFIEGTES